MPNRVYLLIALAFVIGGPIVVSFISNVLPPPAQHREQEIEEVPAEVSEPEPAPEEHVSAPPPPVDQLPSLSEPAFDAAPSLDTDAIANELSGAAPSPLELTYVEEPADSSTGEGEASDVQ